MTAFALAVVASFVLGYVLGRRRSTSRPPGRHSVEYFAMAAEATLELPVITDRASRHAMRYPGGV
ncbi:hypothetical protein IU459_09770 [Nocardia amamiensis]|uniref:Uncharacterized protein n=1 Tax=Nocardia amamiensis TaxID=404578 RepID=A0ABS0CMM0_9NOCA|nr:hypothetical protein [Nocardia amamiensis]MBF6297832.1 hypothetical protein [Nocardia amamiensis]